jgi:hypothetical protein
VRVDDAVRAHRRCLRLAPVAALALLALTVQSTTVRGADVPPVYEDSRALVIAITRYAHWPAADVLSHAAKVADALLLHGFAVRVVADRELPALPRSEAVPTACDGLPPPRFCATVLPSIDAARLASELKDFLLAVDRTPKRESGFLVWFSGHGQKIPLDWSTGHATATSDLSDYEGVLVGAEAPRFDADRDHADFLRHVVPMRDLGTWSRLSPAGHILFVLEACYAGTIFQESEQLSGWRSREDVLRLKARQFLTAGDVETVPVTADFVDAFVDGIDGAADNPKGEHVVTASELGLYVQNRVVEARGQRHTPRWGPLLDWRYQGGDFMFRALEGTYGGTKPHLARLRPMLPVPFRDRDELPSPLIMFVPRRTAETATPTARASDAFVGTYEVTVAEWEACAKAGACPPARGSTGLDPLLPITGVSYDAVDRYLGWLNRSTSRDDAHRYRLPTLSEWRWLAAGGAAAPLESPKRCRDCSGTRPEGPGRVGSDGSANGFGVWDMLGNVWEWTSTCDGPAARDPISREEKCLSGRRLVAGGSWANGRDLATVESFRPVSEDTKSAAIGFRVMVDR